MSTSATERAKKSVFWCLIASAGCVGASVLYQRFGHGVTSRAMTLAFLIPLLGGAAQLSLWLGLRRTRALSFRLRMLQNTLFAGLSALTAGLFVQGIVEIAGVESGYPVWFITAGALLTAVGSAGIWLNPKEQ